MSDDGRDWVQARQARLRAALDEAGLAAFVVFGTKNVRYLTGFTGGDAAALVREDGVLLLTDFRYRLQVGLEAPEARLVEIEESITAGLVPLLRDLGPVGIESNHITVEQWQRMSEALSGVDHRLVAGTVEKLRLVKGPEELPAMREAARLAALTERRLLEMPVVGRTERDVALDLETWVRREGSEEVPFSYIVAAGPRGAMPHAEASSAVIRPGQLLVVDLGATVDGYASDITRTFATGRLDDEQRSIYDLVLAAQRTAREAARPGMTCAELDGVARQVIEDAGKGELFKHSLGHGVGLDVHEAPRVSARSGDVLEPGMVITIEPGVYVPELAGVRIEDTVLVTDDGIDVLTDCDRELVTLS